jgi:hypothetical protein
MSQHGVRCLLKRVGRLVLYGAPEFGRDRAFAILAEQETLDVAVLPADLQAETIAIPAWKAIFAQGSCRPFSLSASGCSPPSA